jgi:hypothetical protein
MTQGCIDAAGMLLLLRRRLLDLDQVFLTLAAVVLVMLTPLVAYLGILLMPSH